MTSPRIGILGSGFIASRHVDALRLLGLEATGVYSPAVDRRERFAQANGLVPFPTENALVADSDVVIVCSPTTQHARQILTALGAGTHVIVEKPVVRHAHEIAEVERAQAASPPRVYVAHTTRYSPAAFWAHGIAARAGGISSVASLATRRITTGPTGARWFRDADLSGGVILDMLIHDVDLAIWFAGPATTVDAIVWDAGAAQYAAVTLWHAQGAVSRLLGGWDPSRQDNLIDSVARIAGDTVHFEQRAGGRGAVEGGAVFADGDTTAVSMCAAQLSDGLRYVLEGTPPRVNMSDAIRAFRTCDAALRSAHVGRPVQLPSENEMSP